MSTAAEGFPCRSMVKDCCRSLVDVRAEDKEALSERDIRPVEAESLELTEKHGVPKQLRMELCFGMMPMVFKSLEVSEKRVQGMFDENVAMIPVSNGSTHVEIS